MSWKYLEPLFDEQVWTKPDLEQNYGFNPFWVPFFCPTCQEAYPREEWDMHLDGYGSCPRGHRRKMEER